MLLSAVLCCLLLSIVQATATTSTCNTCTQLGTQNCDQNLLTAACNGLRIKGKPVPMFCPQHPPPTITSCLNLHLMDPSAPSGCYQLEQNNVTVFCDMEGTNCGGEGGWTRVAYVNMTEPGATCPTGLTRIEMSNLTLCSRDGSNLVSSTIFTTLGLSYSAVCGRLRGYQVGSPDGFFNSIVDGRSSIDDRYADGVSITHGTSPNRQHIWTYAVGKEDDRSGVTACPCNQGSSTANQVPSFIGSNYYCESGTDVPTHGVLFRDDPLWDGMQCNNLEASCCPMSSKQPWFYTTLTETINDYIELRIQLSQDPNLPLDLIELYIR